jgi:2,3-dihydroxy-p-cumate/2,3-dihydroxybenzoate 3,4-dioxygenase
LEQLRYVRIGTGDLAASVKFAREAAGLQLLQADDRLAYFRSDLRDHTLVLVAGSDERAVAFEVRDTAALAVAERELGARGLAVHRGTPDDCAERRVKELLTVTSPGGLAVELVVRPQQSGWRYVAPRDTGITGLAALAIAAVDVEAEERFWCDCFGAEVRDWVGDAVYLGFDPSHHRLAIHPSRQNGILAVEIGIESIDLLMRNHYHLSNSQVRIVHGPGRRPTSGQGFLTFEGPDQVLFSFVTEGDAILPGHRPRQFQRQASSFCSWGSLSELAEFR